MTKESACLLSAEQSLFFPSLVQITNISKILEIPQENRFVKNYLHLRLPILPKDKNRIPEKCSSRLTSIRDYYTTQNFGQKIFLRSRTVRSRAPFAGLWLQTVSTVTPRLPTPRPTEHNINIISDQTQESP